MCGCFCNMLTVLWLRFFLTWWGFLTLTEGLPCFFFGCKADARIKLAKTGHGPHSSTLVVICVFRLLFVFLYVWFVCKCLLPPGDNPTAVNKYIIYIISHHIISLNRACGLEAAWRRTLGNIQKKSCCGSSPPFWSNFRSLEMTNTADVCCINLLFCWSKWHVSAFN
jgi:hypothetical protein